MKKKKIGMIVLLGVLLCVSVIYLLGLLYFSKHFLPDTKLNEIEVSFLNQDETKELLSIVPVKVKLIEKDLNGTDLQEELELTGEQTDLHYELNEIADYQEPLTWFLGLFGNKKSECRQISGSYDKEELKSLINSLYCMQPENQKIPRDAHLELTEEGLKLVEADDGSYIEPEVLLNTIGDVLDQALNGGKLEEIDLGTETVGYRAYSGSASMSDRPEMRGSFVNRMCCRSVPEVTAFLAFTS